MRDYKTTNPKFRAPVIPEFEVYRTKVKKVHDGWQALYEFENNYGASIIQNFGSYGSKDGDWELAVLCDGAICYDTPVTDDVLGHLKEHELAPILADIKALPEIE